MTDVTLHNIRPKLDERHRRLAELQGLSVDTVGAEALSIGVDAIEDRVRKHLLNTREQVALKEAITQIEKVPDATFAMIGKVASSSTPPPPMDTFSRTVAASFTGTKSGSRFQYRPSRSSVSCTVIARNEGTQRQALRAGRRLRH